MPIAALARLRSSAVVSLVALVVVVDTVCSCSLPSYRSLHLPPITRASTKNTGPSLHGNLQVRIVAYQYVYLAVVASGYALAHALFWVSLLAYSSGLLIET